MKGTFLTNVGCIFVKKIPILTWWKTGYLSTCFICVYRVRNRRRSTSRGVSREVLSLAADEVQRGRSIRSVANSFGICHVTLYRYVTRQRELLEQHGDSSRPPLPQVGYSKHRLVFSADQEKLLVNYLTRAAAICFGLSPKEVGWLR